MQQQENVAAAGLGTAIGLMYSWMAYIPGVPPWVGALAVPVLGGALTLLTNRLIQLALDRWLPRRNSKPGGGNE